MINLKRQGDRYHSYSLMPHHANGVCLFEEDEMTTIPATTLSRQLFERGTVRRNSGFNQGLIFAAALYLAVAIVELSIIVLAAPGIAEIAPLYVPVP